MTEKEFRQILKSLSEAANVTFFQKAVDCSLPCFYLSGILVSLLVLHQHMSNNYDSNTLITLIYPLISMAYINRVSFLWIKTARMDKKCFEHFIPLNKKKVVVSAFADRKIMCQTVDLSIQNYSFTEKHLMTYM